jgi:hypothetical protein
MKMYCQNCGAKVDQNYRICPFCGQSNNSNIMDAKESKIRELEQKVADLEQTINNTSKSKDPKWPFGFIQPWMFIFPLLFVVIFFVFFIMLVSIR